MQNDIHDCMQILKSRALHYQSWGVSLPMTSSSNVFSWYLNFADKKTLYGVAKFAVEIPWRLRNCDVEQGI